MSVIVRFAPSPTGVLHIGSVRTALFNWLFAKHNNGKFLLRIEDTDKARSTEENTRSIFKILKWLNLDWDEEPVIQSSRFERHKELALDLVERGRAYFCYCSQEELALKKERALKEGKSYKYDGKCRDSNIKVEGISPVVRLKSETEGTTILNDMVQGQVSVENSQLDDLVLLRSDGTPTYMLSVVADDHDMEITHVIRGDDHLTNAFRQIQIYKAFGWNVPDFAHIPLIHGSDGSKLSKRHGAVSAQDYMDLGYLPEAIFNYLLRLGWSHGNDEIISRENAIEWFNFDSVGKSPSRFDIAKLQSLNAHYIREKDNESLLSCIAENMILKGMGSLKERAKTLEDLAEFAKVYISPPFEFDEACLKYATDLHLNLLEEVVKIIENSSSIDEKELCEAVKNLAMEKETKLVEIAQAIRGALCGKLVSPSVFELIEILGKKESIDRILAYIKHYRLPYKALKVANYILGVANQNEESITNLKLQKLLYYAQAWHLVLFNGQRLFEEEIEAWIYGPVVREVYDKYKSGHLPINTEITQEEFNVLDKETKKYMDSFLEKFINYTSSDLVGMTHSEDPWLNVYDENNPRKSSTIPTESIREYYEKESMSNPKTRKDIIEGMKTPLITK